ncbi:MAG: RHS repeat protein [Ignavibacteriae bacterium]|nr:RHS repeat protein [Ignavibacteriota bacterium]
MTNASENKVLSWIKLDYGDGGSSSRDGDRVHAETSDGKKLEYQFEKDPSGILLLSKVINSDKPDLHYLYQITDKRALLTRKELPEGRFVEIAYYPAGENEHKVASITTPINNKQVNTTQFSYTLDQNGNGATEVTEASVRKSIYLFNHEFQLIGIENYLNGCLYRKYIKSWGKEKDMGNLVGASIQDAKGATFYYKLFSYDEKGNILEEKEYGNLTGAHPGPIVLDEQGLPSKDQESFTKTYSYSTKKEEYIVCKEDAKGNGIKLFYKKGSNLLLEKLTLGRGPKKRYVYKYNEDAALIQTTIDNSSSEWEVVSHLRKRLITSISPKKDLPNVGATEILEKKYLDTQTGKEVSSKKILNKFDSSGNITSQEIYDSNGELRYATKRRCENGLLLSETDPMGNETFYTYDANHNLMSKYLSASELTFEYQYDLRNFLIAATEREKKGQSFTITRSYDSMGNILSEADRLGNKPFTPMTNLAAFFPLPILKFMI